MFNLINYATEKKLNFYPEFGLLFPYIYSGYTEFIIRKIQQSIWSCILEVCQTLIST